METSQVLYTLIGMTAVTQIPRVLPFALLGSKPLPPLWVTWLSFVPSAVILAMLATQLGVVDGQISFAPSTNPFLLAALPCTYVGLTTRNISLTVLTGITALALLRL